MMTGWEGTIVHIGIKGGSRLILGAIDYACWNRAYRWSSCLLVSVETDAEVTL